MKLLSCSLTLLLAPSALAQYSIAPTQKFAWSENCGWTNWFDAGSPAGSQRVRISPRFLSGFAWAENIGWINFGNGSPANTLNYANQNGTDFGVNLDPATGVLSGFAWSENAGWINFSGGSLATPPVPAILDATFLRLRGFVWGENIGWINLNDTVRFIGLACPTDVDDGFSTGIPDGGVTIDDLLFFLTLFENGDVRADLDDGNGLGVPDGGVTIDDLLFFLARFEGGC